MNGVLVVNKPKGITSFDVIRELRGVLHTKKIGHTGTLDPIASGVLILTIGNLTKLSHLIVSHDKEYIATVKCGEYTDSLDTTGKVLKTGSDIVPDNIEEVLKRFEKTYIQEVPIYSAVKVDGKKLYEYARNGESVELPKKEVTIKEIELLEKNDNTFKFRCVVSKGTYIRSLIRDIGMSIGMYFTMSDLVRSREYKYRLEDSYSIDDIKSGNYKLLDIMEVFDYPVIDIPDSLYKKISNGCRIEDTYNIEDKVIFRYNDKVVAIYEKRDNLLVSFRNFN